MSFAIRPPIKIRRMAGGFRIVDANRILACIYTRPTSEEAGVAGVLRADEGEALAKLVARVIRATTGPETAATPRSHSLNSK